MSRLITKFSATSFLGALPATGFEIIECDRGREGGPAVRALLSDRGSVCGIGASLYVGTGGGSMSPRLEEGGTEREVIGGVESGLRRPV